MRYPDRFMDEDRGRVMWDRVSGIDRPPPNTGGIAMATDYDPYDPENLRLEVRRNRLRSRLSYQPNSRSGAEQFALVPMSLWETLNDAPEQTLRLLVLSDPHVLAGWIRARRAWPMG